MLEPMTIRVTYEIEIIKHTMGENDDNDTWEEETDKFENEIQKIVEPELVKLKKKCPHEIHFRQETITDWDCE